MNLTIDGSYGDANHNDTIAFIVSIGNNLNESTVPFNMANMYEIFSDNSTITWGFHFEGYSSSYNSLNVVETAGVLNLTSTASVEEKSGNLSAIIDTSNRWLNFVNGVGVTLQN